MISVLFHVLLSLMMSPVISKFRVRKYTKFGVFYAKIVQMTLTEVTEGVTLTPEIFGNKQGATSTPEIFGNKHSFVLTFFTTNTIYVNCKPCKP